MTQLVLIAIIIVAGMLQCCPSLS